MAKKKSLIERATDAIDHAIHPEDYSDEHDSASVESVHDIPVADDVAKKVVSTEVTDSLRPELGKYSDEKHDEQALVDHPKLAKFKSKTEES